MQVVKDFIVAYLNGEDISASKQALVDHGWSDLAISRLSNFLNQVKHIKDQLKDIPKTARQMGMSLEHCKDYLTSRLRELLLTLENLFKVRLESF